MKKAALFLMILTIVSKILGFGREITLSYIYGASNISDAYLISMTIPSVLFGFVAIGITAGYIPMYSTIVQRDGEAKANLFTNNLINILLVICSIIVLLAFLYTEQIVKVFASGFEGETLALTVRFTKISLIAIYFTGLISIFTGFLQIKGNYIIPALIGIPLNFILILSIIVSYKTNIILLSIGFVIAPVLELLLMLPFILKNGYKHSKIFDFKDKNIIGLVYIILPLVLGTSVNQINALVDRTLASRIAVGGISALNYANRLTGFIFGLFVVSIVTVLYPMISKMAAEENMSGFKNSLSEAITGINILVLPAMIGSMIFATPIISALFGRGAFNTEAIMLTSSALFFYSIGMIGFGLREVLSRAFYSLQDTKTPMINAVIGMALNIILNIILSRYLGISGLALATSIAAIFTTFLLFISLRKKIGSFGMKEISISFVKILFVSLIMGLLAKISFNYLVLSLSPNLSLFLAIGMGTISYFVIIYFMKIKDVDVIVKAIKKKLGKSTL